MIGERIYSVLSTDSALLISTSVIRPIILQEQDDLPAITYQVAIEHEHTFEGTTDLKRATLETNIYAKTISTVKSINTELLTAIQSVVGTGSGVTVFNVLVDRVIEDYETEEHEFRINTQFIINYKEG